MCVVKNLSFAGSLFVWDLDVFVVCKEQSPKRRRKDATDIWKNLYKATKGWQLSSCYPQKKTNPFAAAAEGTTSNLKILLC